MLSDQWAAEVKDEEDGKEPVRCFSFDVLLLCNF